MIRQLSEKKFLLTIALSILSFLAGCSSFWLLRTRATSDSFWIEFLPVITLLIIISYLLNILRKTGSTLQENDTRFNSLLSSVFDSVMICKRRPGGNPGCFLAINEVAINLLEYSRQEMMKMTPSDISCGKDNSQWVQFLDTGESFPQIRRTKSGTEIPVETRAWRVQLQRTPAIMFVDHRQIPDHYTRAQMEAIRNQVETANRAKSAFLANMSHEIRTPMNAILGYTQLLRRDRSLGVEAHEHLDIIHRSGEHLLALINDVLELSKIEAGRAVLNNEPFDLGRLMTDLQRMFQLRIKQKGLCFSVEALSPTVGSIIADQGKVRQILINMLGNAVKFTEKGGIIVRYGSALQPSSGLLKIWVEVEDTGRGISEADLHRVFKPFEQAESNLSEGGTGLGMTISREYARVMSGDIKVKSTLRRGTTFRLEFAASPTDDTLSDDLQNTSVLKLVLDREYTILVADDRDHNRKLLSTLLSKSGFVVKTAADGLEAIEMFKNDSPDLVLMDLKMSSMNGLDAARTIRTLPRGVETPIMLVTASLPNPNDMETGHDVFDTVIRKPFKDTELLVAVRDALRLDYAYEYEPKVAVDIFSTTQMKVSSRIISYDTRVALDRAIRTGDMDRFTDLLDNLALEHPLMAARLRHYADDYDYDKLLLILEDPEKSI